MDNKFLQTVDLEVDGYTITFRVAGMTEFYDVIDVINAHTNINEDVEKLQKEIDKLNAKADKSDAEIDDIERKSRQLNDIFIKGDTHLRRFLMEHAMSISKDGVNGDGQHAQWFIDTRKTETLATLLSAIRPDMEKNLPSQS